MLTELEFPCKELTEWEANFTVSVYDHFSKKGDISDRQFEILERIYAEKTE